MNLNDITSLFAALFNPRPPRARVPQRNPMRRNTRLIRRMRSAFNRIRPAHQHLRTNPKKIRRELKPWGARNLDPLFIGCIDRQKESDAARPSGPYYRKGA